MNDDQCCEIVVAEVDRGSRIIRHVRRDHGRWFEDVYFYLAAQGWRKFSPTVQETLMLRASRL